MALPLWGKIMPSQSMMTLVSIPTLPALREKRGGVKEQQARVRAKVQLMVRAARRLHRAWTRTKRTSHLMEEPAALVLPLFCLAVYFRREGVKDLCDLAPRNPANILT